MTPCVPCASLPANSTAAIAEVELYYASCFIGFTVATTLFGISVLQCYLYFRNHPKDSVSLKSTVASLWLLDTTSTVMVAHSLYTYYVLNFGNCITEVFIPWSFGVENACLTCITIIAQCFYALQIWRVCRNRSLTGGILFLAIVAFGTGIYITARLLQYGKLSIFTELKILAPKGVVQGSAATCDIFITVALVWYLHKRKQTSSILSTGDLLENLVVYTICRGIMTAIAQIAFLALYITFPVHTYWMPFHQVVGKLYVNSVVASLNLRKAAAGREGNSANSPTSNLRFSSTPSLGSSASARAHLERDYNVSHDENGSQ